MNEEPGILLRLSDEIGLTPALLARCIVERHYQKDDKSSRAYHNICICLPCLTQFFVILEPAKLLVSTLMKNTALIDDRDLAFETYLVNYYHFIFQMKS